MNRVVLAVLACVAILSGCEKKVSEDNYTAITNGMEVAEVQRIMGSHGERQTNATAQKVASKMIGGRIPGAEAKTQESTRQVYIWREEGREVSVVFENGKVVDKNKSGF